MKSKVLKVIICAVVFVAALAGGLYLYDKLSQSYSEPETSGSAQDVPLQQAKAFTVYDSDGREVSLSSLKGKPVVLNFWATWCGPCKVELPHFQKAYEKYGDEVQFLLVNMGKKWNDTPEQARELFSENGYTMPIYYDTDGAAADTYAIHSIPQTFFINADGEQTNYTIGSVSAKALEAYIEAILG